MNFFSNLVGQTIAAARMALANANASARQQTVVNAMYQVGITFHETYADVLAEAINNTASVTGLVAPDVPAQLMVDTFPVHRLRDGGYVIEYTGWRRRDCELGAAQIAAILTKEVRKICTTWGLPRLTVWVQFGADFSVRYRVGQAH